MGPGKETFTVCERCWSVMGPGFGDFAEHARSCKGYGRTEMFTVIGPPGFSRSLEKVPRPLRPVAIWLLREHGVLRYDYAFAAFADDHPPPTPLPDALAKALARAFSIVQSFYALGAGTDLFFAKDGSIRPLPRPRDGAALVLWTRFFSDDDARKTLENLDRAGFARTVRAMTWRFTVLSRWDIWNLYAQAGLPGSTPVWELHGRAFGGNGNSPHTSGGGSRRPPRPYRPRARNWGTSGAYTHSGITWPHISGIGATCP